MAKKREFSSSELVQKLFKKNHWEEPLLIVDIRRYFQNYLAEELYREITDISLHNKILTLRIQSALLRYELQMRKGHYLEKLQEKFGRETISSLEIL